MLLVLIMMPKDERKLMIEIVLKMIMIEEMLDNMIKVNTIRAHSPMKLISHIILMIKIMTRMIKGMLIQA